MNVYPFIPTLPWSFLTIQMSPFPFLAFPDGLEITELSQKGVNIISMLLANPFNPPHDVKPLLVGQVRVLQNEKHASEHAAFPSTRLPYEPN